MAAPARDRDARAAALAREHRHVRPVRVDARVALEAAAEAFVRNAAARLAWSGRRLHRALKVARTIADLAGAERVTVAHAAEALQWQRVLGG